MRVTSEIRVLRANRWLPAAGLLVVLLAACGGGDAGEDGAAGGRPSAASAQAVAAIAESYFARRLELNPLLASELGETAHDAEFGDFLSATWLADSLANEQDTAAALRRVDPARLPPRALDARSAAESHRDRDRRLPLPQRVAGARPLR